MTSSESDGVDEAFEDMFDEEFDNIIDSLVDVQTNKPKKELILKEIGNKDTFIYGTTISTKIPLTRR